ncbi:hypothetical protein F7U66_01225 [Vibrio parahaemolyticus]|nr:hypothetical protein [Vibrio parahaemolyticus]
MLEAIENAGYTSEDLDSIVESTIIEQMSRINNEGMDAQLKYLESQGLTESGIMELLKKQED